MNDYIGTDFSKVKVPTSPVIIRSSKTFLGAEGRKQAEGKFVSKIKYHTRNNHITL